MRKSKNEIQKERDNLNAKLEDYVVNSLNCFKIHLSNLRAQLIEVRNPLKN